ncbi:MAG: phenylacetate--CoA ligase family protein [Syntrophales bacterium]
MARRSIAERNSGYFDERAERMDRAERSSLQEQAALRIFRHASDHAPGYKRFLAAGGVVPETVQEIGAFSRLPVLKKNRMPEFHQADPPFGGFLAVPAHQLKRIYVSPGPIYDPEGRQEDYWGLRKCLYNVGFRPGDVVMNTFSYHLTPAGIFLDEACTGIGCVTVPTGVGNTEIQVKTMAGLRINGYIGVPSFLMSLIKKWEEPGSGAANDLPLEIALVAAEMLPPSLRTALNEYGIIVRQAYITADLGGVAYECPAENGMHVSDDLYLEVCDPLTGEPLPAGSIGEVVVTTLGNETYPLIRYGTGDLSALADETCACGRTSRKLRGIMGRADEVTKVKGMFVHPRQVDEAAARFPAEVEKIRLVVTREGVTDIMTVEVQLKAGVPAADSLKCTLEERIREATKLRGNVVFVPALPEGSKKIEDRRTWK